MTQNFVKVYAMRIFLKLLFKGHKSPCHECIFGARKMEAIFFLTAQCFGRHLRDELTSLGYLPFAAFFNCHFLHMI